MLIDAHCHLERETFGDELEAVIARAVTAGVERFIAVGATRLLAGAHEATTLAGHDDRVFATCGIHPHEAEQATASILDELERLLDRPRVVALGEVGLDYYYDHSPKDTQRRLFTHQLRRARERNIPVMLHVRDAHDDTLAILDEIGLPARGGVVHCFTAGPETAEAYLARGMVLSIPGVITFKNAEALRAAVAMAPLERLFVETDCPYLAPIPHRGKRNEPAFVTYTAAAVANVRGAPVSAIARATTENAQLFFALPAP